MSDFARKLSEEEVFQCFKSLNVPVRLNDIKTPTRDFVIKVIEYFLKDLQIDIGSANLRPFDAIQHLEHPEVSEEARMLTLLIMSVNLFIHSDGVVLNFKDIADPKPKRTKKILNYLIVVWNYALRKFALYESIAEGFQNERRKIDGVNEENESLLEKYNERVATLKNMDSTKEELNRCLSLNNERLQEFKKQKVASDVEYQDLKKKEQDLRTQIATADVNLTSSKEAIDDLNLCIISSPEQYTDRINKLKDLMKQEELKIKEQESEYKKKIKDLEVLKVSEKDITKTADFLGKVEESFSRLSTTANQVVVITQKISEQDKEIEELEQEILRKSQMKHMYEDKSAQVQLRSKLDIDTFTTELQKLHKDVSRERKVLESSNISSSELLQNIDKVVDDILQIVECCKQAEAESEKMYTEYSAQVKAHLDHFREDCKEVKEHVKRFFGL